MKPRQQPAPPTEEDAAIWRDAWERWFPGHRSLMFAQYGVSDGRDADLMLCLAFVIPLGPGPKARLLEFFSVDGMLTAFSRDRGMVYVPERDISYFA